MTYRWGWLPLAACMLALVTAPAAAQTTVRDGQSDYVTGKSPYTGADTLFYRNVVAVPGAVHDATTETWQWMNGDASGNLKTAESFPDRETYRTGSTAIINGTYATAAMDSCAPVDVHNYRRLTLIIESPAAGSVRIAVQPRYHIGSATDTTSYFPWVLTAPNATTGLPYVAMGDTIITNAHSTMGTALLPGGDEFMCSMHRFNSGASANDTKVPGRYMKRMYTLLAPGEGQFFDRISVRIRLLGGPSAAATPIKVYLVGSAN